MHNFRLEHFFIFVCACLTSSAIFQIVSALNIWTNSFVALSVSLCLSFSFTYISLSYSYILCPFYINRQVLSWLYHHFLNRTHHAFLHHTLTIPKPFYHKYSLKNRTKLFLQVSIHSHKSRSFPSLSFLVIRQAFGFEQNNVGFRQWVESSVEALKQFFCSFEA